MFRGGKLSAGGRWLPAGGMDGEASLGLPASGGALRCAFLREWYTVNSPLSSCIPMSDRNEPPADLSTQPSNVLTTKVDATSARFEANMRFLADLMSQVRNEEEKISEGGGAKAIENQHAKG